MQHRTLYYLLIILLLTACKTRKASPEEIPFTKDPTGNTWWIANSVAKSETGFEEHVCMLYVFEKMEERTVLNGFVSYWTKHDSSYSSSVISTDTFFTSGKGKFPFIVNAISKTRGANWYWYLGRDKAGFRPSFTYPEIEGLIHSIEFNYYYLKQNRFEVSNSLSDASVYALKPIPFSNASKNLMIDPRTKKGLLNISVLQNGDKLMKEGNIVWMDLNFTDGSGLLFAASLSNTGMDSQIIEQTWDPSFMWGINITHDENNVWSSPKTGKKYPLEFNMDVPSNGTDFIVTARMKEQEIDMKKSSFWMGAVEMKNPETGKIIGYGNMIIFTK